MKVVFHKGVKKFIFIEITMKGLWVLTLFMLLMCLASAPAAGQGTVHIGGGPDRVRIVFDLQRLSLPALEQKDRTLIVNFPDTVGEPVSLTDVFVVKKFVFDGKKAVISIPEPFTYTSSTSAEPAQFILDIGVGKESLPSCPIEHVKTNPHDKGMSIDIMVHAGYWPEVRCAKNKRVFLLFDGEADCSGIEQKFLRIPYVTFDGAMKMLDSTAFSLSIADENAVMEVKTEELRNRIVLDIVIPSSMSRAKVYSLAEKAFDQGDIAETIHTLEPFQDELDAQESILLGRAYWKMSYPYHMDARSMDALKLMNQGVQAMVPGLKREAVMIEYTRMLLRASLHAEAITFVRFLKGSLSPEIAVEAYLQEIDIMNRKEEFQDAFVQNRRMLNDLGENPVPSRLKPYYLSVLGDTYLGLSAYPRALRLYRELHSLEPDFFRHDPGLYARMATAAYRLNNFTDAKGYILAAINLSPREHMADHLLFLGECLYRLGENEKARGVFSEVENIASSSESGTIARLKTARIIMDKDLADDGELSDKGFYEVIDIYENLKSSPEYNEGPLGVIIKIRIAQVFTLRRDWDSALNAYLRAWADTKENDPVHTYAQTEAEKCILARLQDLSRQGGYDMIAELHAEYQDSFMQNLKDPESLFLLGTAFRELKDTDRARRLFLACIEHPSPRRQEVIAFLFSIDYEQGDYASALSWNTRYLDSFPGGKEAKLMEEQRGPLLHYMNRHAEAIPYLELAGGKNDENALTALSMLADAHGKLGNAARRTEVLERIVALAGTRNSPAVEKALYIRAAQLKEAAETGRAQQLFERLLDLYPQTGFRDWALFHLAEIFHAEGKTREAARNLNTVIQRSTDPVLHELATSYLGELELGEDLSEFKRLKNTFGGK